MRSTAHDVAVVGAGPIGSATARHLAEQGLNVVVIDPGEPATFADHQGTWAGHYDEGRLAHVLEVPLMTSLLTMRSIRRFEELAERTGIQVATPTHSVTVMPADLGDGPAAAWFDPAPLLANARDLGVEVRELEEDDLKAAYPGVAFEPGHRALVQRDAFIVNPRALARAELAAATAAGATRAADTVVALEQIEGAARLTGASGDSWTAQQVVLATGAASNATGLLARTLLMDTFGATVVLAEIEDPETLDMPTSMYLKFREGRSVFGGIVMQPRPYPDGKWYIKVAGGSLRNHPLKTAAQIAEWARTGGDQGDIAEVADMLADLLPGRALGPLRTSPCLVAETVTDRPYIDRVDERTVIAVEAERGAMSADEIGRLAAILSQGPWADTIPHEVFHARWAE